MQFFSTPFTFDRVVRIGIFVAVVAFLGFTMRYLAPVVVPFLGAWAIAWVLAPIVRFFDRVLHMPWRPLSIFGALIIASLVFVGVVAAVAPIFIEGFDQFRSALDVVVKSRIEEFLPERIRHYIMLYVGTLRLSDILSYDHIAGALRTAGPGVVDILHSTIDIIVGLTSAFFGFLYLFFILKDYEQFSEGWLEFVPQRYRAISRQVACDVGAAMRSYLRGQTFVALSNAVMFSFGFWLIGLQMWLPLGIFVGLISFVPYIQVVGFVPAAVLAFLEMMEGGRPFLLVMFLVGVVYIVVQVIQDAVITPRVMGKIMGLSPAIVLLALMIWGFIGGLVGLIVALPLTTTLIMYYKRYVIADGTLPEAE